MSNVQSFVLGCVITFALSLVIMGLFGKETQNVGKSLVRKEAIEAGVAEYRCDPKTGETRFEWKKLEVEK